MELWPRMRFVTPQWPYTTNWILESETTFISRLSWGHENVLDRQSAHTNIKASMPWAMASTEAYKGLQGQKPGSGVTESVSLSFTMWPCSVLASSDCDRLWLRLQLIQFDLNHMGRIALFCEFCFWLILYQNELGQQRDLPSVRSQTFPKHKLRLLLFSKPSHVYHYLQQQQQRPTYPSVLYNIQYRINSEMIQTPRFLHSLLCRFDFKQWHLIKIQNL